MNYKSGILSVTAGLLASIAWMQHSTGLLMILAFVLFIHLFIKSTVSGDHHTRIFLAVLPGFLTYNLLSFSWLHKVSVPGAILAIMINVYVASSVFWISGMVYRRTGKFTGLLTLVSLWLTYEHLTTTVSILSPWLNPGNVFGNNPSLVQWYEYTGAGGGSLWIFISAIMSYLSVTGYKRDLKSRGTVFLTCIVIFAPAIFSITRYYSYRDEGIPTEIVIIQPNIDPFTEKFGTLTFTEQLDRMIEMAEREVTVTTDWILFPETAVDDPFIEKFADEDKYVLKLKSFLSDKPETSILAGFTTTKTFPRKPENRGNAAKKSKDGESWYEIYNSGMTLSMGETPLFYHKSKLVPGIEKRFSAMPAAMEKLIPQLGGSISGYGTQNTRDVFENPSTGTMIAPVICYESVFGGFVGEFVRGGADLIFIITNDGWWRNTPGYRQHLAFASLRAIETRRSVARAANTGISCFIDQKGVILEQSDWWVETSMRYKISKNNRLTFYTEYGDFIYRYADIYTVLILILAFIAAPIRKYRFR